MEGHRSSLAREDDDKLSTLLGLEAESHPTTNSEQITLRLSKIPYMEITGNHLSLNIPLPNLGSEHLKH